MLTIFIKVHKTNSAILLKITQGKMTEQETVEVVALGYSAERIYGEIMSTQPAAGEKDERDMHHLFKNFKLMLYQLKDVSFFVLFYHSNL